MTDKERIEALLKEYPYMVSRVAVHMSVDPLSGVNYDKVNIQNTNEFYSRVEEYVMDKDKVKEDILDTLNKIRAVDSVMDIVLQEKERKFIAEYYWQGKSQEQLTDGRYDLFSRFGIRSFIENICEKLIKGGLLEIT